MKEPCSTREAAKKIGISLVTLQRRIADKSLTPPKVRLIGGIKIRLWSDGDIKKARKAVADIKTAKKKKA